MQQPVTTASSTATIPWIGGRGVLVAAGGIWGSGTLTLTWAESATGTFIAIGSGVSLSADGSVGFEMPIGVLKVTLSGSTGAVVAWNVIVTKAVVG